MLKLIVYLMNKYEYGVNEYGVYEYGVNDWCVWL